VVLSCLSASAVIKSFASSIVFTGSVGVPDSGVVKFSKILVKGGYTAIIEAYPKNICNLLSDHTLSPDSN